MLEKCTQLTYVNFYECRQVTGESSEGRFLSELRTSPLFLERTFPPKESTKLPRMAHSLDDSIKNNFVIHVGDKEALKAALPGCDILMSSLVLEHPHEPVPRPRCCSNLLALGWWR